MQRIIVATDGSPGGNRAVDGAVKLARAADCKLLILTVGGSISGAELRQLAGTEGDLSKTLEEGATQVLGRAEARAQRKGVTPVKLLTGWGDPAQAIMDTVRQEKVDLLVIGRRGRGRLSGLLLGSVSQKLASLAPCQVMVVP
jgi:nucleotide-binding universal stress UspA family protein